MSECGGRVLVDGETIQGQTDDGSLSFELRRSSQRQLPTNSPGLEPNARANTEHESFQPTSFPIKAQGQSQALPVLLATRHSSSKESRSPETRCAETGNTEAGGSFEISRAVSESHDCSRHLKSPSTSNTWLRIQSTVSFTDARIWLSRAFACASNA